MKSTHFYRVFFTTLPAIFILVLSACKEYPPVLAEYDGINLIKNNDFDAGWFLEALETSDPLDYMFFEEITDPGELAVLGSPDGTAGSRIYRFEIVNLVPDGDFESAAVSYLPTGWSLVGAAFGEVSTVFAESGSNSLRFSLPAGADNLQYNLTNLLDTYPDNADYILRFDVKPDTARILQFYFPSSGPVDLRTADIGDASRFSKFPDEFLITTSIFPSTGGADYFNITGAVQAGYIDNLRIARSDEHLTLNLTLTWTDADRPTGPNGEVLELVSGWYQYSVWVKNDPSVGVTLNRFASDAVTIGLNGTYRVFTDGEPGIDFSKWTQVSEIVFLQIDEPADAADVLIELTISPSDKLNADKLDAGSLCIAFPTLFFYSSDPRG